MFVSALKRQYWAYFLVVLSVSLVSVFTRGFTKPLALGIAVEIFMIFTGSFLLFCIGYCAMGVMRWLSRNLLGKSGTSKIVSIVILLLLIASIVPLNAEAQTPAAEGGKKVVRDVAIFIAGTGFGAACSDLWNAGKDALTDAVKSAASAVVDHYNDSYYCSGCGQTVSGSHQCGSSNYYYDGSSGY